MYGDETTGLPGGPTPGDTPDSVTERQEDLAEQCSGDRESLSPKETADCAGHGLSVLYDNEEDGGS